MGHRRTTSLSFPLLKALAHLLSLLRHSYGYPSTQNVNQKIEPKSRLRNGHWRGNRTNLAFSDLGFATRLTRTLQVLAMTGWEEAFGF